MAAVGFRGATDEMRTRLKRAAIFSIRYLSFLFNSFSGNEPVSKPRAPARSRATNSHTRARTYVRPVGLNLRASDCITAHHTACTGNNLFLSLFWHRNCPKSLLNISSILGRPSTNRFALRLHKTRNKLRILLHPQKHPFEKKTNVQLKFFWI